MSKRKQRFPLFPHVRQAFGMDINQQEHCLLTGLDKSGDTYYPGVISGDWSNNWVPDSEEE